MFFRNKLAHYRLIGECLWELLRACHVIRFRPFEQTARMLNQPLPSSPIPSDPERVVLQVRGALGAIYRRIPWRPTCLMRAVAANRVLARRRIASELVLSVAPSSGDVVDAHAWLEACGVVVTGRREKARFVAIYTFCNASFQDADGTLVHAYTENGSQVSGERDRSCSL